MPPKSSREKKEEGSRPAPEPEPQNPEQAPEQDPAQNPEPDTLQEIGGQKGPEPTRYGDWEKNGICSDF